MFSGCSTEGVLWTIMKNLGFGDMQTRIVSHRPKEKSAEENFFFLPPKTGECMWHHQGLQKKELVQLLSETYWIQINVNTVKILWWMVIMILLCLCCASCFYPRWTDILSLLLGLSVKKSGETGYNIWRLAFSSCCSFFLEGLFASSALHQLVSAAMLPHRIPTASRPLWFCKLGLIP